MVLITCTISYQEILKGNDFSMMESKEAIEVVRFDKGNLGD